MVGDILELAGVKVDVQLWVGGSRSRLNDRISETMRRFDDYCSGTFGEHPGRAHTAAELARGQWPVAALVHGDTTSALAAALASFHLRIPVIHVEAGLRTGGHNFSPFPEELNRQLITRIASFHLAPTAKNQENLVREAVPADQIFVTGNSGIDALRWAALLDVPVSDPAINEMLERDEQFVVVTAHRRENWGGGLGRIAEGVSRVARTRGRSLRRLGAPEPRGPRRARAAARGAAERAADPAGFRSRSSPVCSVTAGSRSPTRAAFRRRCPRSGSPCSWPARAPSAARGWRPGR